MNNQQLPIDFLIAASDFLLLNSVSHGRFEANTVLRTFDRAFFKNKIAPETEVMFYNFGGFELVTDYMIAEGFIRSSGNPYAPFEMTELGRSIKKRDGINQYEQYNERLEAAVFKNLELVEQTARSNREISKSTKLYLLVTFLMLVVTFLIYLKTR